MASNPRRRACSPAACEQPGSKVDEKSDRRMEPDDASMASTRTTATIRVLRKAYSLMNYSPPLPSNVVSARSGGSNYVYAICKGGAR